MDMDKVQASNFKFGIQLVLGEGLAKKQLLRPKLAGVRVRGASEKMWDPVRIFATVEVSNFKFGTRIGFGTSLPKKRRLGPKLAGAWAREASEKIWDPVFISATVQLTEKLVHNRFTLPNTSFRAKLGRV